jgi:methionyl aminopeptidase
MVLAIEPFSTPGTGRVKDSEQVFIFNVANPKPVRNQDARRILSWASRFHGLPFAQRWLERDLSITGFKLNVAMKELLDAGALNGYPVLKEVSAAPVGQAEHTVIVGNPSIVTTR